MPEMWICPAEAENHHDHQPHSFAGHVLSQQPNKSGHVEKTVLGQGKRDTSEENPLCKMPLEQTYVGPAASQKDQVKFDNCDL